MMSGQLSLYIYIQERFILIIVIPQVSELFGIK